MFHMSRDTYDKIEALAKSLRDSDEYKALKEAEDAGENDKELSACVAAFIEKRQKLEDETLKDEKDFDLIGALTREIDEENERMMAMSAYKRILEARKGFNSMMAAVNDVMQAIMFPDVQCSCSGDCASCGGCSSQK